jgi:hypothetical protein
VKEHAQQYFQKLESDGGSSDMLSIKHDMGFSSPLSRIKNEPLSPSLKSPFASSILSHSSAPFDTHELGQGLAAPLFPPASHATFLSDAAESYITSAQFVQQSVSTRCSGSVADAFAAGQAGGADSKEEVTWTLEENVVFENALSTYDERVAVSSALPAIFCDVAALAFFCSRWLALTAVEIGETADAIDECYCSSLAIVSPELHTACCAVIVRTDSDCRRRRDGIKSPRYLGQSLYTM